MDIPMTNQCCGERDPHVVARRQTADGMPIEIWHDGAITGRLGRAIPGVPVARPRSSRGVELARAAASLVAGDVEIRTLAEVPRLVAYARRVAARGGTPGDLRQAFFAADRPILTLAWEVYAADRDGAPTVRVARLDRIRWPGLVVWHERGRYELLALRRGCAVGARSREALEDTGFSFSSQRALVDHLFRTIGSAGAVA
jgi:hypothetical protein